MDYSPLQKCNLFAVFPEGMQTLGQKPGKYTTQRLGQTNGVTRSILRIKFEWRAAASRPSRQSTPSWEREEYAAKWEFNVHQWRQRDTVASKPVIHNVDVCTSTQQPGYDIAMSRRARTMQCRLPQLSPPTQ